MVQVPLRQNSLLRTFITTSLLLSLWFHASDVPLAAEPQTSTEQSAYTFGVFPFLAISRLEQAFAPIADDLSQVLDRPVRFRSAANFEKFMANLKNQTYDIAFIQPFDYVHIAAPAGYIPLAARKGTLAADLMVKRNSPLQNGSDIRGKRLGLPPEVAAVSYLTKITLSNMGLSAGQDVSLTHFRTHDACLQAVLIGTIDVCASVPPAIRLFEQLMQIRLRKILSSDAIPQVLFVVHERVPVAERKRIQQTLLSLPEPLQPRQPYQIAQVSPKPFQPVEDGAYDSVREYWQQLEAIEPQLRGKRAPYVLGVYPHFSPRLIAAMYAPVAAGFSRVLGHDVQLRTSSSFEKFSANLDAQAYNIVLVQPFDYVRIADTLGYLPLARLREPHILFAAHSWLSQHERTLLKQTILGWPGSVARQHLLKQIGIASLVSATDAEYDVVRHYSQVSLAERRGQRNGTGIQ